MVVCSVQTQLDRAKKSSSVHEAPTNTEPRRRAYYTHSYFSLQEVVSVT